MDVIALAETSTVGGHSPRLLKHGKSNDDASWGIIFVHLLEIVSFMFLVSPIALIKSFMGQPTGGISEYIFA